MSLTNSNTYIEPTAGTALNTARLQQNDSYRSLLTNFKSPHRPVGVNISSGGGAIGEQDGMLYRSATTNALYISDTVHKKSSRVGGNFTRIGIGNRVENGIVALGANAASYEIGELVATVSESGSLAANSRLYLCISNSVIAGSTAGFLDVGNPQGYTIGALNNVTFSGQSVTSISFLATSNVGIRTTAPQAELHVVGNAIVASNAFIRMPLGTTAQRPVVPVTGMFRFNTSNTTFEGYTGTAWSRLGSLTIQDDTTTNQTRYITFTHALSGDVSNATISSTKLFFNPSSGRLTATDFNSLSDVRVKSNVHTIDNALDKVLKLRGTYFDIHGYKSIGLIAQEIEQVLPEVVTDGEYKTVSYGNIVAVLIEAIKELNIEIEKLKDSKDKKLLTKIKNYFRVGIQKLKTQKIAKLLTEIKIYFKIYK
jgi:hypothetical protein